MEEEIIYYEDEKEPIITAKGFFGEVKKRWYIYIAVVLVLAFIGAVVGHFLMDRSYYSYATIIVKPVTVEVPEFTEVETTAQAEAEFILSKNNLESSIDNKHADMIISVLGLPELYYKVEEKYNEPSYRKIEIKSNKIREKTGFSRSGRFITVRFDYSKPGVTEDVLKIMVDELNNYVTGEDGDVRVGDYIITSAPTAEKVTDSKWLTGAMLFGLGGLVISVIWIVVKLYLERNKSDSKDKAKKAEKE